MVALNGNFVVPSTFEGDRFSEVFPGLYACEEARPAAPVVRRPQIPALDQLKLWQDPRQMTRQNWWGSVRGLEDGIRAPLIKSYLLANRQIERCVSFDDAYALLDADPLEVASALKLVPGRCIIVVWRAMIKAHHDRLMTLVVTSRRIFRDEIDGKTSLGSQYVTLMYK
jgi:hypothetical protein